VAVVLAIFSAVLAVLGSAFLQGAYAQPAWQVQWEDTIRAAEKEGRLVVYCDNTIELVFLEAFQKKYPKIAVTTISASGSELNKRILSERRAGKYLGDVFIPGGSTDPVLMLPANPFDSIRSQLILPEVLDPSKWWQGKHHYLDQEGQLIFWVGGSASSGGIFYNTYVVDPNQIKSFWDLLGAHWKGKIAATDPTVSGPGITPAVFFYHHPDLGPKFVAALFRDTEITVVRTDEQLIDWVAAGKFALGLFPRASALARAINAGLPLREFATHHFKEGGFVSPSAVTVSILNRAPHPNAAKVAINWFLSREGQMKWLEYVAKVGSVQDPLRVDFPREEGLRGKREPGAKYFNTQTYELITNRQPVVELIKKSLESKKQ
jgi:ABC-type Fe3+ transport system substrate-binding protein